MPTDCQPARSAVASGRARLAAAVLWLLAGCGGSTPTAPTPQPPPPAQADPLQLTCPGPLELRAVQAQPVPLVFDLPQSRGGTAPVTVACTPSPGAAAPVGTSTVTCTATDARQMKATCEFPVRVVAAPRLRVERILALGDSLTFGVVSRTRPLRVIEGDTYVAKLQTLLAERYFDQQPTVFNSGVPGERADQVARRYGVALRETNADVMILLAGANDLAAEGARAVPSVVRAIETITRDAQGRGVAVILSTLPPQRPGSLRGAAHKEVVELNAQILGLCSRYGALCADVYTAMGGEFTPLIGADGLHPTLAGYDRMAETYFDVIVRAFEDPSGSDLPHDDSGVRSASRRAGARPGRTGLASPVN